MKIRAFSYMIKETSLDTTKTLLLLSQILSTFWGIHFLHNFFSSSSVFSEVALFFRSFDPLVFLRRSFPRYLRFPFFLAWGSTGYFCSSLACLCLLYVRISLWLLNCIARGWVHRIEYFLFYSPLRTLRFIYAGIFPPGVHFVFSCYGI